MDFHVKNINFDETFFSDSFYIAVKQLCNVITVVYGDFLENQNNWNFLKKMNHTEQRLLEIGMKNMPFSLHTKPERLETLTHRLKKI